MPPDELIPRPKNELSLSKAKPNEITSRMAEDLLAIKKDEVLNDAVVHFKCKVFYERLPNVKQGVRSHGLKIKRLKTPDLIQHLWNKCYVDPEANANEEELGIDYDRESSLLHVTPSLHGDFIIWFRGKVEGSGAPTKLACRLTVIQDPETILTA